MYDFGRVEFLRAIFLLVSLQDAWKEKNGSFFGCIADNVGLAICRNLFFFFHLPKRKQFGSAVRSCLLKIAPSKTVNSLSY